MSLITLHYKPLIIFQRDEDWKLSSSWNYLPSYFCVVEETEKENNFFSLFFLNWYERKRNSGQLPPTHTPTRNHTAPGVCVLTRNWTCHFFGVPGVAWPTNSTWARAISSIFMGENLIVVVDYPDRHCL